MSTTESAITYTSGEARPIEILRKFPGLAKLAVIASVLLAEILFLSIRVELFPPGRPPRGPPPRPSQTREHRAPVPPFRAGQFPLCRRFR